MASPNDHFSSLLSSSMKRLFLFLPLLFWFSSLTVATGPTNSTQNSLPLFSNGNSSNSGSDSFLDVPYAESLISSGRSLTESSNSTASGSVASRHQRQENQKLNYRLLVLLKLLQLFQLHSTVNGTQWYESEDDEKQDQQQHAIHNGTTSESRSVFSWLGLRRPSKRQQKGVSQHPNQQFPQQQQQHPVFLLDRNNFGSPSHHNQNHPPPLLQQRHSYHPHSSRNFPHSSSSSGGSGSSFSTSKMPHSSHNSLFDSLDDANGIDYWLKFLEEANFEEKLPPLSGGQLGSYSGSSGSSFPKLKAKTLQKMKPMSVGGNGVPFKRVKANRYRPKSHHNSRNHHQHRHTNTGGHGRSKHTNKNYIRPTSPLIEPIRGFNLEDFENTDNGSGNLDLSQLADSKPTDSTKQVTKTTAEPYAADTSPRCDKFTDEICIDDFEYPENAILEEIFQRKDIFQLMYSEVKGDAPLVDGIARDEEEGFSQDYYYNNNDPESDDYDSGPPSSAQNQTEYNNSNDFLDDSPPDELPVSKQQLQQQQPETDKRNRANSNSGSLGNSGSASSGFVCRSEVLYAKPKLARNIKGKWKVIVNAGEFTQTIRLEKCTRPNAECRFIADHKYDSRCAQISAIHRLLVFEKGKGFYIDTFRVPTACTCHVVSNKAYLAASAAAAAGETGSSSSMSAKRERVKSNLGETLWSLLGTSEPDGKVTGGGKGSNHRSHYGNSAGSSLFDNSNYNRASSKNDRKSSSSAGNSIELLKLLPQLTSIAPENVLQQLLDEYADSRGSQRHSSSSKGYGNRVPSTSNQMRYLPKIPKSELQQLLQFAQAQNLGTVLSSGSSDHKHAKNRNSDFSGNPATTTTTTIVSSNTNPGSSPVVQVIHVPVSASEMAAAAAAASTSGEDDTSGEQDSIQSQIATSRNRFRPIINPIHLIAGNGGSRSSSTLPKHSKYLITTSNYLQSQSQRTNSSVQTPPNLYQSSSPVRLPETKESSTEQGSNNSRNEAKKQVDDKRVNFSYHPILDYIAS